jgi:hypothetical protein
VNLDLSGVVVAMADTTLSVTRHVAGWGSDGRATDTTSSVSARALVAPSRRTRLPELAGNAVGGRVDVYAATRLYEGDSFAWQGGTYVVETVAGYESTGNFCVAVARRTP